MATSKNVIAVNDANFDAEVLRADRPVLVDVSARWCGPCKLLAPIVDAVADERAGALKVVTVDLDASPGVVRRYGIHAAPTLLVFRGGEKKAQRAGAMTKASLLTFVDGAAGAS
ncbi:MAG TPA: thioredoxin domain-containing protein [Polyangiaceae bacterium]|nr:thioredoxin domain-containing protein [Polyangiaceae bacterium]